MFKCVENGGDPVMSNINSYTISQILENQGQFDKAFWTTFSVDFTTLYFLLKQDLIKIINPCCFHLICDGRKLDESIVKYYNKNKDISKLIRLQEYCTISPQFTAGAFHPKILFFASDTKILAIVSSANATSSGLLSNQDLVGIFCYEKNDEYQKYEIISIFNYLYSFSGWCDEALEDLRIVYERFDFLKENSTSNRVFTVPGKEGLLTQIAKSMDFAKLQNINIYTPFLDNQLAAVREIKQIFNVPTNVYTPLEDIVLDNSITVPCDIRFFSSKGLKKEIFHAKFYDFQFSDYSIVFWGSANCSYSGLLDASRNHEILISSTFTESELNEIWGESKTFDEKLIALEQVSDNPEEKEIEPILKILKIHYEESTFEIHFDKHTPDQFVLIGVTNKYDQLELEIIHKDQTFIRVERCDEITIIYAEQHGDRISNYIFVNDPFAIKAQIEGRSHLASHNQKKDDEWELIKSAFNLFNLDPKKTKQAPKKDSSKKPGFWRLSRYSRKFNYSGIILLEEFVRTRTNRYKTKNDEESEEEIFASKSYNKSYLDFIIRETSKLIKNIKVVNKNKERFLDIDSAKWFQGMDQLSVWILEFLENMESFEESNKNSTNRALFNLVWISTWMSIHLQKDNIFSPERIEVFKTMHDVFLSFASYRYLLFLEYTNPSPYNEQFIELKSQVKQLLFLRHLFLSTAGAVKSFSEHSMLTIQYLLEKCHNPKIRERTYIFIKHYKYNSLVENCDLALISKSNETMMIIDSKPSKLEIADIMGRKRVFDPQIANLEHVKPQI
jgi:HKD family nuclease